MLPACFAVTAWLSRLCHSNFNSQGCARQVGTCENCSFSVEAILEWRFCHRIIGHRDFGYVGKCRGQCSVMRGCVKSNGFKDSHHSETSLDTGARRTHCVHGRGQQFGDWQDDRAFMKKLVVLFCRRRVGVVGPRDKSCEIAEKHRRAGSHIASTRPPEPPARRSSVQSWIRVDHGPEELFWRSGSHAIGAGRAIG